MVKLLVTNKFITPKTQVRLARRWFRRAGLVSCLLLLVFCGYYLVFESDYFVIKNVNCWVQDKTSLADEKRWCEAIQRELEGQRMFLSNLGAAAPKLKNKFLPVGEVVIKKKYPRTVLVQISERQALVRVCSPEGRSFLADDQGVIFSQVTPETKGLKKVVLELGSDLAVGQTVDKNIVFLLLLEDPRIKVIKRVDQQGIEARVDEGLTIFFSREKDFQIQIRSLQMIVKKYRIEGKELKSIDLRYEQPVVKY